jgi:hypothetical protein
MTVNSLARSANASDTPDCHTARPAHIAEAEREGRLGEIESLVVGLAGAGGKIIRFDEAWNTSGGHWRWRPVGGTS